MCLSKSATVVIGLFLCFMFCYMYYTFLIIFRKKQYYFMYTQYFIWCDLELFTRRGEVFNHFWITCRDLYKFGLPLCFSCGQIAVYLTFTPSLFIFVLSRDLYKSVSQISVEFPICHVFWVFFFRTMVTQSYTLLVGGETLTL